MHIDKIKHKKIKNKGISLIEVLITLVISASLISILGLLITKGIKINKNGEQNYEVFNEGLIISDIIYRNMRYTSPNLVNIFSNNQGESFGIGFPVISGVKSVTGNNNLGLNVITPEQTGYNVQQFDCLGEMTNKLSQKSWQGYIMYILDKDGTLFGNGEDIKKNCLYEIKYSYQYNNNNNNNNNDNNDFITILTRKTNADWGSTLFGSSYTSSNSNNFYEEAVGELLSSRPNCHLMSKHVISFKISSTSYPAIKMSVLMDYGVLGGKNIEGRQKTNKAESFEIDWVVLPVN